MMKLISPIVHEVWLWPLTTLDVRGRVAAETCTVMCRISATTKVARGDLGYLVLLDEIAQVRVLGTVSFAGLRSEVQQYSPAL